MAPSKTSWDDEEEDSTPPSSPPVIATRRGKFDDEEDEDVLDSWDAAEDSEEEREKAKKAAEAKAKADAEAKANHKSRAQRIEEKREERLRQKAAEEDGEESEDEDEAEAEKRARKRATEKASDLQHAEDLFGGVGGVPESRTTATKAVTVQQGDDPNDAVDLSKLKIFNPATAVQFNKLREVLVPLLNQNGKKPQYELFMKEFTKQIVRDLNSEQVKKIASGLTTISNEKMKEEKASEKGGKKSKAAKTKTTLNANKSLARDADVAAYDDGIDEDDFM